MKGVRTWLDGLGIAPTDEIERVHERPWSVVLRIPTAEGDLYLKQCGPVQAFEVPLTAALASRWPDRVPQVVAADQQRAWLLLRDGGTRLREIGLDSFPAALRLYGELQVGEADHVEEFLRFGAPDVRVPIITAAYEPFFDRDHGLRPNDLDQLRSLGSRYRELCGELTAFGLPDSIQHDDLHDGNVFIRDGHSAIFDWGDASVAHPLFSWLKPLRATTDNGVDPAPFRDAYLEPWLARASERDLLGALRVAVPVGTFAYALQYERQLNAMSADARPSYSTYMSEQLRILLRRLGGQAA